MKEDAANYQYSSQHTISFTEKAWYEHAWEFCKEIPNEFSTLQPLLYHVGCGRSHYESEWRTCAVRRVSDSYPGACLCSSLVSHLSLEVRICTRCTSGGK